MSGRLQNQVAWISGAASGMGEAVAHLFAEKEPPCVDRRPERQRPAPSLNGFSKRAAAPRSSTATVRREDHVKNSIDQIVEKFGSLHIVVNCAGIVQVKQLHELEVADWDRLMDINLKSIFLSTKHAVPHLRKNSRSYIVNHRLRRQLYQPE